MSATTTSGLKPISLSPLITDLPQKKKIPYSFLLVIHFVGVHSRPPEQKSIQSELSSVGGQKMAVSGCFFLTDHGWCWMRRIKSCSQNRGQIVLVVNLSSGFQQLLRLRFRLIYTENQSTAHQASGERNLSLVTEAKWDEQLPHHVQPITWKALALSPSLSFSTTTATEAVVTSAHESSRLPPSWKWTVEEKKNPQTQIKGIIIEYLYLAVKCWLKGPVIKCDLFEGASPDGECVVL